MEGQGTHCVGVMAGTVSAWSRQRLGEREATSRGLLDQLVVVGSVVELRCGKRNVTALASTGLAPSRMAAAQGRKAQSVLSAAIERSTPFPPTRAISYSIRLCQLVRRVPRPSPLLKPSRGLSLAPPPGLCDLHPHSRQSPAPAHRRRRAPGLHHLSALLSALCRFCFCGTLRWATLFHPEERSFAAVGDHTTNFPPPTSSHAAHIAFRGDSTRSNARNCRFCTTSAVV